MSARPTTCPKLLHPCLLCNNSYGQFKTPFWGLQGTGLRVTQILSIDYSYIWLLSNKLDKCYMNVIEEDL